MTQLFVRLLSIKHDEIHLVGYFFLTMLFFAFGSSIARSIGMTMLVQHLGGDVLPKIFILVDGSAMLGFVAYAKYTKNFREMTIINFLFVSAALFCFVACGLFLLESKWVFGFFFVGFFFFYIIISIHIGSVVAAFFTTVQVKRVTGIINAGLPIGGALGGSVLVVLLQFIDAQWLALVFGFAFICAYLFLRQISTKFSPLRSGLGNLKERQRGTLEQFGKAFQYIRHSRLMIYMTIGVFLFVGSSKLLEYQYQGLIYPEALPDPVDRATFFATYEIFANLAWLLLQLFFSSRIIVKLGVGASNIVHPVMVCLASVLLLFNFSFAPGFFAQFINQEIRGAIRSPANNMLFNAVPPNMWGDTKAFINGLIFPFATFVTSISLLLMKEHFPNAQLIVILPAFTLVLAVLGIITALPQWAAYNQGVFGLLNRNLFAKNPLDGKSDELEQTIKQKLNHDDPQSIIVALGMIRVLKLDDFVHQVGKLLCSSDNSDIKLHCIDTLAALSRVEVTTGYLLKALKTERKAEILSLTLKKLSELGLSGPELIRTVEAYLLHPSPAVFVQAALCLYHHPAYPERHNIEQRLLMRLGKPGLPDFPLYLYALGELGQSRFSDILLPFLSHREMPVRLTAFTSHIRLLHNQDMDMHKERFVYALHSPSKEIKIAALRALRECSPPENWFPVINLLRERDPSLLKEAKELLRLRLNNCQQALIKDVFDEEVPVEEKFEILSLVYPRLGSEEQRKLLQMGRKAWEHFFSIQALSYLYQTFEESSPINDLVLKSLREISEDHLRMALTAVTYLSNESRDFFLHVIRGLLSANRANQGNALEVLSNVSERRLTKEILKYYEERPKNLDEINALYHGLFDSELPVKEDDYRKFLIRLPHHVLRACLHYNGEKEVEQTHESKALLGLAKNNPILCGT